MKSKGNVIEELCYKFDISSFKKFFDDKYFALMLLLFIKHAKDSIYKQRKDIVDKLKGETKRQIEIEFQKFS